MHLRFSFWNFESYLKNGASDFFGRLLSDGDDLWHFKFLPQSLNRNPGPSEKKANDLVILEGMNYKRQGMKLRPSKNGCQ
jgi:hypothetical protein